MPDVAVKPFQILALSGGGFRGLYTARILAFIIIGRSTNWIGAGLRDRIVATLAPSTD